MTSITIAEAKSKLYSIVNEVNETSKAITLINNRDNMKNCVLISESNWNSICETIYLNSIRGFVDSIKKSSSESKNCLIREKNIDW